jgi:hypothetical protein
MNAAEHEDHEEPTAKATDGEQDKARARPVALRGSCRQICSAGLPCRRRARATDAFVANANAIIATPSNAKPTRSYCPDRPRAASDPPLQIADGAPVSARWG